jgi:hypothetical protein
MDLHFLQDKLLQEAKEPQIKSIKKQKQIELREGRHLATIKIRREPYLGGN